LPEALNKGGKFGLSGTDFAIAHWAGL
jgi:hypothetical protein